MRDGSPAPCFLFLFPCYVLYNLIIFLGARRSLIPVTRQASATLTLHPTVAAISATVRAWEAIIPYVSHVDNVVWGLGLDPLPPALYARHPGSNALGICDDCDAGQQEALLVAHLTISWTDITDDDVIDTASRDLIAAIQRDVSALGDLDPFVYFNYAAAWQSPFAGYNQSELERLRNIRQQFDPRGVFTKLVPGGFKIPQ